MPPPTPVDKFPSGDNDEELDRGPLANKPLIVVVSGLHDDDEVILCDVNEIGAEY